jgi:hypothetical protein
MDEEDSGRTGALGIAIGVLQDRAGDDGRTPCKIPFMNPDSDLLQPWPTIQLLYDKDKRVLP